MATSYTDLITTTGLPHALRTIYSKELEFTAKPKLIYDQFVEPKGDFKAEKGERVYWTIYRQLPPSIGKLTETTDVDGGRMSDFQVNFTVDEYGYAIGTTKKLDLLSYHGPISNICRQLLAPQVALTLDILARNAFIGSGATYRTYAGTATSRATLLAGDTITDAIIRGAAHRLSIRRVPMRGNNYICITHPSVIYDVRNLSEWRDAQYYAQTKALFTGEVGELHGIRFIEADNARLPNAGATTATTTLNGAVTAGATTITVASPTGFEADQEITLFASTSTNPDGTDATEEHVVIDSIDGSVFTLKTAVLMDHSSGDKVREGLDIFPLVFLGGDNAVGKGVVFGPTVNVAPPVDKLGRMWYVGWYGLLGYGVIRNWAVDVVEMCATQSSAPAFPW